MNTVQNVFMNFYFFLRDFSPKMYSQNKMPNRLEPMLHTASEPTFIHRGNLQNTVR